MDPGKMLMSEKHREKMQKRAEKEMAKALAVDASIFGASASASPSERCSFARRLCAQLTAGRSLCALQTTMARTMKLWLRGRRQK